MAFDGQNIWVTNQLDGTVTVLRASDGACVGTCTFAAGHVPELLAFDGANMWVTLRDDNTVRKF